MSVHETERRPSRPLPLDDPIYRPRTISKNIGLNYFSVLEKIRRGEFGVVIQLGPRAIGVRASAVAKWLEDRQRPAMPAPDAAPALPTPDQAPASSTEGA